MFFQTLISQLLKLSTTAMINHVFKTKKITIPVKEVSISVDFDDFYFSVFSLVFVSIEKMSQTLEKVGISSVIQTPRISSKILRCESYFQLSSLCFSCLIRCMQTVCGKYTQQRNTISYRQFLSTSISKIMQDQAE